jgi:hypothetical protein
LTIVIAVGQHHLKTTAQDKNVKGNVGRSPKLKKKTHLQVVTAKGHDNSFGLSVLELRGIPDDIHLGFRRVGI